MDRVAYNQIDRIEDWLHSGNIADLGKADGGRSRDSSRHVDIGSGKTQGIGTRESGVKTCQRDITEVTKQ